MIEHRDRGLIKSTVILTAMRLGMGAMLFGTGVVKYISWPYFPYTLRTQYTMIPSEFTFYIALVIPLLEIIAGVLLLAGIKPRYSSIFSLGLFLIYSSVLTVQHYFISPVEDCGCTPTVVTIPVVMIIMDLVMVFFCAILYFSRDHPFCLYP